MIKGKLFIVTDGGVEMSIPFGDYFKGSSQKLPINSIILALSNPFIAIEYGHGDYKDFFILFKNAVYRCWYSDNYFVEVK